MSQYGFLFDLDGVIVDTAKYHFLAWKRLADELDIPFTEQDNERLKGVSRMASLEIILEIGNRTMTEDEKQAIRLTPFRRSLSCSVKGMSSSSARRFQARK